MVPAPSRRSANDEKITQLFRRKPARRWLLTLAEEAEAAPDPFRAALAHRLALRLARLSRPASPVRPRT
jgi:hypothetical protein